jgi:hypothetical protein
VRCSDLVPCVDESSSCEKNITLLILVPLTVYTTCSELGPEQPLLRLRLDIPSTDCTILPAQTAIDSGRWAMKLTTALHPNWVRDRHICSPLLPVLATWECCVSLCKNSGKRLRFLNQLEREEQLTEQRKHGRAERRERKGHLDQFYLFKTCHSTTSPPHNGSRRCIPHSHRFPSSHSPTHHRP